MPTAKRDSFTPKARSLLTVWQYRFQDLAEDSGFVCHPVQSAKAFGMTLRSMSRGTVNALVFRLAEVPDQTTS